MIRLTADFTDLTIGPLLPIPSSLSLQSGTPTVIPRQLTAGLLASLAVLGVTFTVLMGFYLLVNQLRDEVFGTSLLWAGRVCLLMLLVSFVLLVLTLALDSVTRRDRADEESE